MYFRMAGVDQDQAMQPSTSDAKFYKDDEFELDVTNSHLKSLKDISIVTTLTVRFTHPFTHPLNVRG